MDIRASIRLLDAYSTDQLPSPSSVARKLLALSTSDSASTREIAQVVKADPALCGRLLKLVNSPLVGFSRPVAIIDDAVIIVGVQAVHKLAIGMSVLDKSRHGRCAEFDYDCFWRHSVLRAVAAQTLAAATRVFNPGEAFSLALLADIGKLTLATLHPSLYARTLTAYTLIAGTNDTDRSALLALEREHFATDHCELSHALLMDWGFIDVHLTALKMYYSPDAAVRDDRATALSKVLRGAELSVAHLDAALPAELLAENLLALFPRLSDIGLDGDAFLAQIRDSAAQWESILGLARQPQPAAAAPPAALPAADTTFDEHTSHILIADDDPMIRTVLNVILAQDGYQVTAATDGAHALNACLKDDPEIIVLDWEMPGMSGVEVCRAIRKTVSGGLYYIIVLTSHSDETHLVEAFAAGADDFIKKPVSPAELRARVAAAARLVQLRRQVERERNDSREHVAKIAAVARRMRDAALTDFLTDIPNRRNILDILNNAWSTSDRSGSPLSCMLIDIDHFKNINDVYGHDVGDLVLQRTARSIRDNLRCGDTVGRLGGEEFLVVAPLADHDAALQLGERLRLAVKNLDYSDLTLNREVTISIGIATRGPTIAAAADLVTWADNGLLEAKRSGRNRCQPGGMSAVNT